MVCEEGQRRDTWDGLVYVIIIVSHSQNLIQDVILSTAVGRKTMSRDLRCVLLTLQKANGFQQTSTPKQYCVALLRVTK